MKPILRKQPTWPLIAYTNKSKKVSKKEAEKNWRVLAKGPLGATLYANVKELRKYLATNEDAADVTEYMRKGSMFKKERHEAIKEGKSFAATTGISPLDNSAELKKAQEEAKAAKINADKLAQEITDLKKQIAVTKTEDKNTVILGGDVQETAEVEVEKTAEEKEAEKKAKKAATDKARREKKKAEKEAAKNKEESTG